MPLDKMAFTTDERKKIIDLARLSIAEGLRTGRPVKLEIEQFSDKLIQNGACFVTLEVEGNLRGCIGMLEAIRPLAIDVAENAYAAAFCDPRFSPLSKEEFGILDIHVSVLTPNEPIEFDSEEDLIKKIRPNIDGLILEAPGGYRGTFLPSVWEQLKTTRGFLRALKQKAGLSADYWSNDIQINRYETVSIK